METFRECFYAGEADAGAPASFNLLPAGSRVSLLEEAPKGTLGLFEFVAGKAGIVNRNGRYYSEVVYELATERAQPMIREGRFLGEVDHPWYGTLSKAAFRVTELKMDGAYMKAKAVILETEGGRHLKALLDGGVGVAISTRGYGSSKLEKITVDGKEVEVDVIQNDFRLEGIDAVLFPSNPSGAVTRHENQQESKHMDLEELLREHPDLVAQIESSAREGFVAESEVEAQVSEREQTIARIAEALAPLFPALAAEAAEVEQTEAERQVEALSEQVRELNARIEAEAAAREAAQNEAAAAAAREALREAVNDLLDGYEHAELIRSDLESAATLEEATAIFESRKALIEAAFTRGKVGKVVEGTKEGEGTGRVGTPKREESVDDEARQHRHLISDLL